jgi:stearoyl-CoA desaturase (delta-9 desaturase)
MSIGFHRYFSHKAFKTNRFWHQVMLWGGTLAGQGSVVFWVALHRIHHPNSDRSTADIHSPKFKGFWHAYMGWIFTLDPAEVPLSKASDVIRDPVARFTHRHYHHILWLYWTVMLSVAVLWEPARPFIAGALFAGSWSIHQEALVNSVCHDVRFGNAPYASQTKDSSRNVPLLHYLLWGQSYHNNHHAWPASANFCVDGKQDIGYRIIKLIAKQDLHTV